jgi:uncharacterized membrane protein YbhN (UPF0104 family)
MTRRRGLTAFLLSVGLSIGLLAYLLSRIEWADLVRTFTGIHVPSLAAYAALSLAGVALRAGRYRLLIGPERIGPGAIVLVTLVRNLFIDLLPAKVGSLSYIYLLVRRFAIPLEVAASTFVLAAVFDALALGPLLLLAIAMVGLGRTVLSTTEFALVAAGFLLGLLLLLLALPALLRLGLRVGETLLRGARLAARPGVVYLVDRARGTIESVEAIQRRKIYWSVFGVSFLLRLAKYGSLYFVLHALLANQGFPLATLSFWKVVLGVAGAEFSANLPVQGLAGVGTWETAFALAFRLMGYEERIAIVAGLGLHLITQLFEYALGAVALVLLGLSSARREAAPP